MLSIPFAVYHVWALLGWSSPSARLDAGYDQLLLGIYGEANLYWLRAFGLGWTLEILDPLVALLEFLEGFSTVVHTLDALLQVALLTVPAIKYPIYVWVAGIKEEGITAAAFYDWQVIDWNIVYDLINVWVGSFSFLFAHIALAGNLLQLIGL